MYLKHVFVESLALSNTWLGSVMQQCKPGVSMVYQMEWLPFKHKVLDCLCGVVGFCLTQDLIMLDLQVQSSAFLSILGAMGF